jgi:hypothetical protein
MPRDFPGRIVFLSNINKVSNVGHELCYIYKTNLTKPFYWTNLTGGIIIYHSAFILVTQRISYKVPLFVDLECVTMIS